ncbi:MAG: 2-oxo acid dehydrogenase subunit E2 [Candidatus Omnitrophica bacterium]|nr:2-oxo acid dehydrogenase subunit E2 [Candidatus Omnitrophota bacterium]
MDFKLPELGENIESGDVVGILVAVGDSVAKDQPLLELETDKAQVEVPSPAAGTVSEILIKEGDTVKVGQVVMKIDSGAEPEVETKAESKEEPRTEPEPEPQVTRQVAPQAEPQAENRADHPTEAAPEPSPKQPAQNVVAGPSVRKLARELGIDVSQVPGSGRNGRISTEDIKVYAKSVISGSVAASGAVAAAAPLPDFSKWGETEAQPLTKIRQVTAQNMAQAWSSIPHVTQFDKSDITELDELRKRFGKRKDGRDRVTVTAIILKVTAAVLKQFPQFNASLDLPNKQLILKKYVHLGVAVDTEQGLLVPVLRDADQKSIVAIAEEIDALATKARNKKLSVEEMQGASFTISNLGGIGGTGFTPIVNPPQVAILGVSRGQQEVMIVEDEVVARLMLPISVSYDHRAVDGADGARFLRTLAEYLSNPLNLLVES